MKYQNWLFINDKGKQVIARYNEEKDVFRVGENNHTKAFMDRHFDFVGIISDNEAATIRLREARLRAKSGKQRVRPVFERNHNGFNVIARYEKVRYA